MHDHHGHSHSDAPSWFFQLAIVLNAPFFFTGLFLWYHSGSVAILGDAIHNFFHAALYLVALWGNVPERKRRQMHASLGIGAMILLTVPLIVTFGALGILRPEEVVSRDMIIMATLDLAGELILGGLALRIGYHGTALRKIYLVQVALQHILIDALGSIGVLVGGLLIWKIQFYSADGIAAIFIAGIAMFVGVGIIRKARGELLESEHVHESRP